MMHDMSKMLQRTMDDVRKGVELAMEKQTLLNEAETLRAKAEDIKPLRSELTTRELTAIVLEQQLEIGQLKYAVTELSDLLKGRES